MIAVAEKRYSVEEYFELEATAEIRHEFVDGILIPMPGESKIANKIAKNCIIALDRALEGKHQEIYSHDVRLAVKTGSVYRYPDLVVAPETDNADTHAILEPTLVIEVLPESTRNTDHSRKLTEYTNLPSLHYYFLVSQDECLIETYSRKNHEWVYNFHTNPTEKIPMPFFAAELLVGDVYKGVQL